MAATLVKQLAREYLSPNVQVKDYSLESIKDFLLTEEISEYDYDQLELIQDVHKEIQNQLSVIYPNLDLEELEKICVLS